MIKLIRGKKPEQLTDNLVQELTEKFKKENISVWNESFIKTALSSFSHGKCCYCETRLGEESKYLTVDHFHHKSKYPDEVVEWDNLLPCCSRCNSSKNNHDTYMFPIINPTKDNPQEHLYISNYRYKVRNQSETGRMTKEVLGLNDTQKLVFPRVRLGEYIQKGLEDVYEKVEKYDGQNGNVGKKNKIINSVMDLLREASPESEYSASVSTVIFEDDNYIAVKKKMKESGLWNDELEQLENKAKSICLSKYPIS